MIKKFGKNNLFYILNKFKKLISYNNELYLNNLLELCKIRFYGIYKYKNILKTKHIKEGLNLYTIDEEQLVLRKYFDIKKINRDSLNNASIYKKLINKLNNLGFSKYNINKLLKEEYFYD